MARDLDKLKAKEMYCKDGKTIQDIATALGLNLKTLYRWRDQDNWDKDREIIKLTGITAVKDVILLAVKKIEEMVTSGVIDPKQADAFIKMIKGAKLLEKDINRKGNIIDGVQHLVEFMRESHPEALQSLTPYLGEFGQWVTRKYPS